MSFETARTTVTIESRLVAELNGVATAYVQARGKERQLILRRYVKLLKHLTDRLLAELEGGTSDARETWNPKCHDHRSRKARSAQA